MIFGMLCMRGARPCRSVLFLPLPLFIALIHAQVPSPRQAQELLLLHLIFLRFVFRDTQPAVWKAKESKLANQKLRIDLQFTLYAGYY